MADRVVRKGKKSKKGVKTKLSKFFRRKKRYNEFGSSANIVKQCEEDEIEATESLKELSENGVGSHSDSQTDSCKLEEGQSLSNGDKTTISSSGVENVTIVTIENKPSDSIDFQLIDLNVSHEGQSKPGHYAKSDCDLNIKRTSNTTENITSANCPDIEQIIEKTGVNIEEKSDVQQTTAKPNTSDNINKRGKSKTFRKFKRKFRLSKYRELSESRGNVANGVSRDDEYEDVKKKKRLQETGKNVGKALRNGLTSVLDGYKNLSPFSGFFSASYYEATYHSTTPGNSYSQNTRYKSSLFPIFS